MTWPIELYIASRYIRANLRHSLIIMLAVGLGVAIIIFIPSVNLSFFEYFLNQTIQNSAHINITRELETMPRNRTALESVFPDVNLLYSDQTLERRRNITAWRQLMTEFQNMPGVTAAAPYIRENIIVVRGSQSRGGSLTGIVPELERTITNIEDDIVAGSLDGLGSGEVILGKELARELNVALADRVQLVTAEGSRSFKVAGIISTGVYASDLSSVYLPLKSAQTLLNMSNTVTGIGLKVRDYNNADGIARQISNTYNVKARSWMEDNKVFLDQIGNFRVIIAVINFLIIFAAASSITSILIMVVASKSREIGILKAMGASPATIMRVFVIQAIFLSLIGAATGVVLALGLIAAYNASPMARGDTVLGIERPPTTLNVEYTIIAIVYSIISSILSSLIPSWQAGRLNPVEAINQ